MKRLLTALAIFMTSTQLAFAESYERIVTAGGDITEIVFALGQGGKVVGVDSTSIWPEQALELDQIGYVRGLAAEGVLSLAPDLLLGAEDSGPPNVIENLKLAGVTVETVPATTGPERYEAKLTHIGAFLGVEEKAATLLAHHRAAMADLSARRAKLEIAPKVLFILSVRDGAPIVGGSDTTAHDIIELAGGQNMAASFEGWKPMNSEAIITSQPDIIVMTDIHSERLGGTDAVMARPDIRETPAGQNDAVVVMNAQLLLQFGPRLPQAVDALMTAFENNQGT
ncbi:MAG: ABC transporter substrate-binding protein [Pseudomonadota bacterium]